MRRLSHALIAAGCWSVLCGLTLAQAPIQPPLKPVSRPLLSFEENRGQVDSGFRFLTRGRGYTAYLRANGYSLVVPGASQSSTSNSGPAVGGLEATKKTQPATIRARFVGADRSAPCTGHRRVEARSHYLLGRDPSGWTVDVPHYERVLCKEVYAGVDVAYYGSPNGVEFDLILEPNGDPAQIRLAFEGADGLDLNGEGDLVLRTSTGTVRHSRPTIYQTVAGETVKVTGGYVLEGGDEVRFELADYDRTKPLVIDPVINWATFLGGSADDSGEAVAVDADGNVYVTGRTSSMDFPAGDGLEDDYQGGADDAFVAKLSPDGTQLIFATYLGGTGGDMGGGIAVDPEGNIYVSGATTSADFPTTPGSLQPALAGNTDAFVVKLNPQGSVLIYGTYFGGPVQDVGDRMRLDAEGNVYVTGSTDGSSFPTTEGAFQTAWGGQLDAFVAKIDAAGANLVYATYLGGNGSEIPADIEINRFGEAHIAGLATSNNFPGTPGAFQEQVVAGGFDAFVAKFDATGSSLEYFSFLGGSGNDQASGLALDSLGNVWLSGGAESQDFPTTADAPFPNFLGGPSDGFLARLPLPQGPMAPLEPEEVAGEERPAIAPFITYVGDELRNFGLDVLVVTLDESIGPAAKRAKGPGLGTFIDYSLSNFSRTPVVRGGQTFSGPFWTYWNLDFNGNLLGDPLTAQGAEALELRSDGQGGAIGIGLALGNAPTTPGTVDPDPNPGFDAWAVNVRLTQARMEVEKQFLEEGVFVVGDTRRFLVIVRSTGSETANNVTVGDFTENFEIRRIGPNTTPLPTDVSLLGFPCRMVNPTEVFCPVGDLQPGQTYSFEVVGDSLDKGQAKNTARVTWDNRGKDETSLTADVFRRANLRVMKEIISGQEPVQPGDSLRFRITVENVPGETPDAQDDAVNVVLKDDVLAAILTAQPSVVEQPRSSVVTCPSVPLNMSFLNRGFLCQTNRLRVGERFVVEVDMQATTETPLGVRNSVRASADNAHPDLEILTILGDLGVIPGTNIFCVPEMVGPERVRLREGGTAEQLPNVKVNCENVPGSVSSADVLVDFFRPESAGQNINAQLVTKQINVGGASFGDSVLITGDPPLQDQVLRRPGETPTGNENMILPYFAPGPRVGSNSLLWEKVPINPDANGNFSFQVTNLRTDPSGLNPDDIFGLDFSLLSETAGLVRDRVNLRADIRRDSYFVEETLTPRIWRVGARVNWRGSSKKRIETTGGPEPVGTPVRTSSLSFPFTTNSGFIPPDDVLGDPADPNAIGAATNGNRLYVEVNGVPAEVLIAPFPGCIDSDAFSGTGPGGRMQLRRVDGFNDDFSGGSLTPNCDDFAPLPGLESFRLNYEVVGPSVVTGTDVLDSFDIPFTFNCSEGAAGQGSIHIGPGPILDAATFGPAPIPIPGFAPMTGRVVEFDWAAACRGQAFEEVTVPGVVNSATFRPEDLPVPGGLITLGLQNGEVIPVGTASSVPLPRRINDVEVFFLISPRQKRLLEAKGGGQGAPQESFVRAPLLFVSPTQLNVQFPWEIDPAVGVVEAVIVANGIASAPIEAAVAPFSPGIFSFDFGAGRAVATNLDATVAQVEGALDDFGLPARPVRIGDFLVILATGLGPVDPPAVTGDDSLDEDGNFVQRNTVTLPTVFIGGVEAQVVFSGLSPQFPGVYQLNVIVGDGTPIGDAVSLVIEIGGVRSRDDVTIAVGPAG